MTELTVRDASASGRWYVETLGFVVELTDAANGFVLLEHPAGGRLALKVGDPVASGVKLHLEVSDLDGHVVRLHKMKVELEGAAKVSPEGYRRVKLSDPDGVTVVLFEWCRPGS